jgi:hypothetical protein
MTREKTDAAKSEERQQALQSLLSRSASDLAFRNDLLREPRRMLEEALDCALPEDFTVQVVENRGADLSVVLPDVAAAEEALSDEDLEAVAGGMFCLASCAASCAVTSTDSVGVPGIGGAVCL